MSQKATPSATGQVSADVARGLEGFDESDIDRPSPTAPMCSTSPPDETLLDIYLGLDWDRHIAGSRRWARIRTSPTPPWRASMNSSEADRLSAGGPLPGAAGYSKTWQELSRGSPGGADHRLCRRPLKQANMILSDLDRLDRILNHPTRPVHIVFTGKARRTTRWGKTCSKGDRCLPGRPVPGRSSSSRDTTHRIARHRPVDVWLNNRGSRWKRSGTSSGGVTASQRGISDGWWVEEGYDGTTAGTSDPP